MSGWPEAEAMADVLHPAVIRFDRLSLMRALGVVGLGVVGLGVVGIAVVFPGGDFVDEGVFVGDPSCKLLICDITKSPSMFDARSRARL
jgi:hypothetical protein